MSLPSPSPEGRPPEDRSPTPIPPQQELPEDVALLKTVLPPLLDDFRHWFTRTIDLLEAQTIGFLSTEQQQDLLTRVKTAQQQVNASQVLSSATDSQAGIDMAVVMTWHKLVHECWGVAIRYRKENATQPEQTPPETDAPTES
ncbi:MAG: DUF2605 domain-containing protein [Cyanobacteria bacterium J06598_3]